MGPTLTQFRIEAAREGLVHLVFNCPGRTMNVFSEAAIADLGAFAAWLPESGARGVVIRSGKANAFCAGADLTELGVAYDMIMAAPPRARFNLAFDHFFRLGTACRALETAGVPVAAAVGGIALGGGCELALAAHHRVLVDDPQVAMGLPESLVGLLPGSGGTQRLPRLVGIEAALPVLLEGARLGGRAARDAGLVHALAAPGEEVAAAEDWLLGGPEPVQPWDRDDWEPPSAAEVSAAIAPVRERVLAQTLGHYPAPLAILNCIEFGLPQQFDGAIRAEMSQFALLIQREEARNMIRTLFLAKTEYDRLERKGELPGYLSEAGEAAEAALSDDDEMLGKLGFAGQSADPVRTRTLAGYWLDREPAAQAALVPIGAAVAPFGEERSPEERALIDYAVVSATGYPAYLGGPLAFAERG